MKVRIAPSTKMPTLYSYYVSKFTEDTLEKLNKAKPFSHYNKKTQEYETTQEVYFSLKETITDRTEERLILPRFERTHNYKYGYQEDTVAFAMQAKSLFINFPQGMGKTLTTLKVITARNCKRTLVICGQGNLQEEWVKDTRKHNFTYCPVAIVGSDGGTGNARKVKWLQEADKQESFLHLINIEALRDEAIVNQIIKLDYDCIVVDEVQSAKGWKSEQTKGLHELPTTTKQLRIALSGTPILNNPLEYFSLLKFLNILNDTARTTFEKYYGVWTFDFWGHYICSGYKNLEELKELVSAITCTVTKDEIGLLPKTRVKVDLPYQSERYDYLGKVYKMSAARLKKQGFTSKPQIRSEMLFLSSTAPSKIEYVKQQTDKCLVFSQYTQVLEVYQAELIAAGKRVLYYHGKLNMAQRLEVLQKWARGEADILLLSLMTARYGLNLTEACKTIFIEPPTSLAILEQCEDRAHRIGQKLPCSSILLVSTTLDLAALENLANKQDAIEDLKNI